MSSKRRPSEGVSAAGETLTASSTEMGSRRFASGVAADDLEACDGRDGHGLVARLEDRTVPFGRWPT